MLENHVKFCHMHSLMICKIVKDKNIDKIIILFSKIIRDQRIKRYQKRKESKNFIIHEMTIILIYKKNCIKSWVIIILLPSASNSFCILSFHIKRVRGHKIIISIQYFLFSICKSHSIDYSTVEKKKKTTKENEEKKILINEISASPHLQKF